MKSATISELPVSHTTGSLQVRDSLTLMLVVFCVSTAFAVLLCYYPGPKFLGSNFWPIFGIFAIIAAVTAIKMLTRKAMLKVDETGINFLGSNTFIHWADLRSAEMISVDEGEDDPSNYLVVKYLDKVTNSIKEVDFLMSGSMNSTHEKILAAINHFRQ